MDKIRFKNATKVDYLQQIVDNSKSEDEKFLSKIQVSDTSQSNKVTLSKIVEPCIGFSKTEIQQSLRQVMEPIHLGLLADLTNSKCDCPDVIGGILFEKTQILRTDLHWPKFNTDELKQDFTKIKNKIAIGKVPLNKHTIKNSKIPEIIEYCVGFSEENIYRAMIASGIAVEDLFQIMKNDFPTINTVPNNNITMRFLANVVYLKVKEDYPHVKQIITQRALFNYFRTKKKRVEQPIEKREEYSYSSCCFDLEPSDKPDKGENVHLFLIFMMFLCLAPLLFFIV